MLAAWSLAAAAAAQAQTTQTTQGPLQPLDPGVEDVGPLGVSTELRSIDFRAPTNFEHVYRAPGREHDLMRVSGAILALFPRSEYAVTNQGTYVLVPAGTVFYLGEASRPPWKADDPAPTPAEGELRAPSRSASLRASLRVGDVAPSHRAATKTTRESATPRDAAQPGVDSRPGDRAPDILRALAEREDPEATPERGAEPEPRPPQR